MNAEIATDIMCLVKLAEKQSGANEEWLLWSGIATRVRAWLDTQLAQPTTPEPAGETVRVRAGAYWDTKRGEWWISGMQGHEPPQKDLGDDLHFIANIDLPPEPRIPTVAARVVEGQS